MNCRALFSQEYCSAKSRQASRDSVSASRQATRRSSSSTPTGWSPTTSFGPVTGNAATGTPHASASSCTTPNVSVRLGKTNTSAAARCAASCAVFDQAEEFRIGKAPLQFAFLRAVADHYLRARQIERQERFQVFLDRNAAHADEDRPPEIEIDGAIGAEQIGIDAAGPHAETCKAALGQFSHQ